MKHGTPLAPITKHGAPYLKKIPHVFIMKHGTPLVPITKHGTPYLKKFHNHSLRNNELFLPVTKHGTPYLKKFHTHSLRNIEILLPILLNMELLMWKSPTTIHYETRNSSWRNYEKSKHLKPKTTIKNSYFEDAKCYKRASFR